MNCLDFRRIVLVDPRGLDPAAREHAAACPACAQFHERALELDDEVLDAARITVPAGLADQVLGAVATPSRLRRSLYAMAASVVLAVGLAVGAWYPHDDPLARAGIDFVVDEEASAILSAKPADQADLQRVARALDVHLPDQLGTIRYIGTCPFGGVIAHHVVVTSPTGKVTLLLLPDRSLSAPASASSRGFRALVKPVKGGSVAIIANTARGVERTSEMLVHG
ncbi:MAG: DUF3379 family protein [Casimicrobiaceae bacterium]